MTLNLTEMKILVAENVDQLGDLIETVLSSTSKKNIFIARNSDHAYTLYNLHRHDLLIVDLDINTDGGIALAQKIKDGSPDTPFILMASYANDDAIEKARESGINDLLIKPFSFDDLMKHINYVMSMKGN